jgi:protoporphyrinogen oxidase
MIIISVILFVVISIFSVIKILSIEHPTSTSKFLADDALEVDIPKSGLKGKSIIVVGGGISGLSAAKYLLEAGAKVTLLEKRQIVGGNNDPYLKDGKHYATTVIVTLPCQQPHYLNLCREYGIEQTPHNFVDLEGQIILQDKALSLKMGSGGWSFFKYIFKQCTIKEIIDGICIMFLFYYQFRLQPESKKSIKNVLGNRLTNSSVFTHVFMPWIGINTWCRFDDISSQPAHIFGAFIYEYALKITIRKKDYKKYENGWCVLDGRLIHKLEENLLQNNNYTQKLNTSVIGAFKDNNKISVQLDNDTKLDCDKILFATQPFQALPLIKNIGSKSLINELKKWPKMDCYVILHRDLSQIKNMPWIHQTHMNKTTNKYYITNTIKPIMSDIVFDCTITFVYNTINYEDFIKNQIDESKIIKIYEPKLPIFTLDNSVNRNKIWNFIDNECQDVYWTQACKSGIQYHNNAILNSKRVVKCLINNELSK